jgi:hypothetical protein
MPEHLRGLRRLSPCCHARIAHRNPIGTEFDPVEDALSLLCVDCCEPIAHFELWNAAGECVWPIDAPPSTPLPSRIRRRRVPQEAEPTPFTVQLPGIAGLLRRLR